MAQIIQLPADPINGVDYQFIVPAGKTWILRSFAGRLVTDITAIVRKVRFVIIEPGARTVWTTENEIGHGLSLSADYFFGAGISSPNPATIATVKFRQLTVLAGIVLQAGWLIGTNTENLQANDQWSRIAMVVDENAS